MNFNIVMEPQPIVSIEQLTSGVKLDKRTYVPTIVRANCPGCLSLESIDLTSKYLSYPVTGVANELNFVCRSCETEFHVLVIVELTLRVA
jgi:hypothetical protein